MLTRRGLFMVLPVAAAVLAVAQLAVAADNPTVSIIGGHNANTPMITVPAGTTKLGALNTNGEAVFNLQNGSGKPFTTLVVSIDAGVPLKPLGYGCSVFTGLLKACTVNVSGSVINVTFTGAPAIKPDGQFRLGFAPGVIAGPWPAGAAVSVAVHDQVAAPR